MISFKVCTRNEVTGFGLWITIQGRAKAEAKLREWLHKFPNNKNWISS